MSDDILHVYESRFPGQIRGMSWLSPVATRLIELDSLEDAAVMKAKTTCLLAGFITNLEGGGDGNDFAKGELSLEPGTLRRLPPGQSVSVSPTSDMAGLADLLRHMGRSIAAGSGVPYQLLAADLSDCNYSSAKLGLENFKRRCGAIRASLLGTQLLDKVWRRFATLEVLSGRLSAPDFARDPDNSFSAAWLWPQWAALDPYREASADVILARAGLRSCDEIIAARGRDVAEVNNEIMTDPLRDMLTQAPARLGGMSGGFPHESESDPAWVAHAFGSRGVSPTRDFQF